MSNDTAECGCEGHCENFEACKYPAAKKELKEAQRRLKKALDTIVRYGGFDGDHHKAWALDQAVRALTGCPMVKETVKGSDGKDYPIETQGESHEYLDLVRKACEGEDGPNTYDWDVGIPP